MPVQNSICKISFRPDLATQLLQMFVLTTFNSLMCQESQFTLQPCSRRCFFGKDLVISLKESNSKFFLEVFACINSVFILENYLSKRQAGQVLAKSL